MVTIIMKTSTTVTHDHAFADYWTIYRVLTLIVFCFLFVNFSLAPCGRRSWLAILASFLALVKFILSYRIVFQHIVFRLLSASGA